MFSPIFHGHNHPICSSIEVHDTLIRHFCSQPVGEFLLRFEDVSKKGKMGAGQGYDFIIEEINAETKAWIPRGVPDDETWFHICRNLPNLIKADQIQGRQVCLEQIW